MGGREESEGGRARKYQRLNKQKNLWKPSIQQSILWSLRKFPKKSKSNLIANELFIKISISFINLCKSGFICFLARQVAYFKNANYWKWWKYLIVNINIFRNFSKYRLIYGIKPIKTSIIWFRFYLIHLNDRHSHFLWHTLCPHTSKSSGWNTWILSFVGGCSAFGLY